MRYQYLLLTGLCSSLFLLPNPVQANPNHDTMLAFVLANQSVHECYGDKDLAACSKLDRIQSTLITWCNQKDQDACDTLVQVQSLISAELFLKF
jgi:hypothetical protein